jgi:molybdate transport system substrate-binding protein
MYRLISSAAAMLLFAFTAAGGASAAEIKILAPGSTESSLSVLVPQFEQASGHKVTVNYGPVGALAARVEKGEAADVVILSSPAADGLRQHGKLVAGSEILIAKVGIGVFVRKGDPKPDISTVDTFLHALADARSIAYADPKLGGSSSILVGELMNSLDVTGSIKPKTRLVPPAQPLLDLIASGGADFGFNPISEILPDQRLELVGPLPAPIQKYTRYVGNLVATSQQQDVGKALMTFLSSSAASKFMQTKGFEPL